MTDKIIRVNTRSGSDHVDVRYADRGDGTYSMVTFPDLKLGAKSLVLTLAAGVGSVPIPDLSTMIGVKPVSSTVIRVGLEAPEADGSGAALTTLETDLKKGVPVDSTVWTWFFVGVGVDRVLYVKGGTTDVLEVAVR